jgi:DNA repair photolyase
MVAPVIPGVTDHEIEAILTRAHELGAREAGYILLRLPLETQDLFANWLLEHHPDKYRKVMSLLRSTREGKIYDSSWGKRMTGTGPYAWMIGRRFEMACDKIGLNTQKARLRSDLFVRPQGGGVQLSLF